MNKDQETIAQIYSPELNCVENNNCYVTEIQMQTFHQANITRIVSIEQKMQALQLDTSEIVEWVRNGKLSAKVASKIVSGLGRSLLWLVKVVSAAVVLYAAATAIKEGKVPDVNFLH